MPSICIRKSEDLEYRAVGPQALHSYLEPPKLVINSLILRSTKAGFPKMKIQNFLFAFRYVISSIRVIDLGLECDAFSYVVEDSGEW